MLGGGFGMFGGLQQSYAVRDAQSTARKSASKAQEAKENIRWLEDRLERLTLVCMGMWELLQERASLTEEDLAAKVQEIDLRDGQADGKASKQPQQCPKCSRTMSPRHARCLYCGYAIAGGSPFDKVG